MTKLYEVQEHTICDGWVNHWTLDGEPMVFTSKEEAQTELDEYLNDCALAVEAGDMEDAPSLEDFRIVEVQS